MNYPEPVSRLPNGNALTLAGRQVSAIWRQVKSSIPSWHWEGLPFAGQVVATPQSEVGTEPDPKGIPNLRPGSVLMNLSGKKIPADDPRAIQPPSALSRRGTDQRASEGEGEKMLKTHLAKVLRALADSLEGKSLDQLMRKFVEPGATHSDRALAHELARRLLTFEKQQPQVIIGVDGPSALLAAHVTQILLDDNREVAYLSVGRNLRVGAEGYTFHCSETEIRSILSGKRVFLVMAVVTALHLRDILEQVHLIEMEQCAAQVVGIGCLIQIGEDMPELAGLKITSISKHVI